MWSFRPWEGFLADEMLKKHELFLSFSKISSIEDISLQIVETNINLHHFHIHKYGNHTELTFHVELPKDTRLETAHDAISKIEKVIKNELDIETTIHVETIK